MRRRLVLGPALAQRRFPIGSTLLSAASHAVAFAGVFAAATYWQEREPRTYIVNLVPTVAAVGRPEGRPAEAPRPEVRPAPKPAPKPATKPAPAPDLPPPELPARHQPAPEAPPPALPPRELRARESVGLPERDLPLRAPGLPRPSEKERPSVASLPARRPGPEVALPAPAPAAPPAPPVGIAAGSPQGAGALTLNVSDFPYAWYIQAIHRKIKERWDGRAIAGKQPAVIFQIDREGRLTRVVVDKSSGNPYYDQIAMRSVAEAQPFPPLPADFPKPVLTVGLQFAFDPSAGR